MISSVLNTLGKGQFRLDVTFSESMRNDVLPSPLKWQFFQGLMGWVADATNWASFTVLEVWFTTASPPADFINFLNAPSDVQAQNGRYLDAAQAFPI